MYKAAACMWQTELFGLLRYYVGKFKGRALIVSCRLNLLQLGSLGPLTRPLADEYIE
jgi:hypothetical protein